MGATSTTNGYSRSKARPGLVQTIISEMPEHDVYIEGFAGRAAVFHEKRAAAFSYLIEADPVHCHSARSQIAGKPAKIIHGNVLDKVPKLRAVREPTKTLAYFDPPRLLSPPENYFNSEEFHEAFLDMALKLSCRVMIHGLRSDLYDRKLKNWRKVGITYVNHRPHLECVWCNFPKEVYLHDPRYLGNNYRQRERIKRKHQRWQGKFGRMERSERQAVICALAKIDRESVKKGLDSAIAAKKSPTRKVGSR
jgi:DNA adenine methylase